MVNREKVILSVEGISKEFSVDKQQVLKACNNITFQVAQGKTLGIVGESGCGKSTLVRTIMGIHKPTVGRIMFAGTDITTLRDEEARQQHRHIQMIFQDPTNAFNPKMKIKEIVCEPLLNYGLLKYSDIDAKAKELLEMVQLPTEFKERYPHNMSGGQRQRVGIARALALEPEIIICDEATSALDVSVQEEVMELLAKLQKEKGITYIFICHDLALVDNFSHRVIVMYLGNVMENFAAVDIERVCHPYTQGLLGSVFKINNGYHDKITPLEGDVPSPLDVPEGCPFQTRCSKCQELCRKDKPSLVEIAPQHFVACHYAL